RDDDGAAARLRVVRIRAAVLRRAIVRRRAPLVVAVVVDAPLRAHRLLRRPVSRGIHVSAAPVIVIRPHPRVADPHPPPPLPPPALPRPLGAAPVPVPVDPHVGVGGRGRNLLVDRVGRHGLHVHLGRGGVRAGLAGLPYFGGRGGVPPRRRHVAGAQRRHPEQTHQKLRATHGS